MLLQGLEMLGSLEPLANAQKGTAGARVVFDLVRSRADRLASQYTDSSARPAMFADDLIDRGSFGFFAIFAYLHSLRLANATARLSQKAALDDSIFQRVKRNHRQAAAASQR